MSDLDLDAIKAQHKAAERAWKLFSAPPSIVLSAANATALVAEVERLRHGLNLILEFPESAQAIADEALGNVVGGSWFGPEVVER